LAGKSGHGAIFPVSKAKKHYPATSSISMVAKLFRETEIAEIEVAFPFVQAIAER